MEAATDLHAMLADPPATGWVEFGPDPTKAIGPFTAEQYAAYAGDSAGAARMAASGFLEGYGRAWLQRGTQDELIERVFQFSPGTGAASWYSSIRVASETSKYYKADITLPADLPNSFGVVLIGSGGTVEYRVDFYVADYVFVVHAESRTDDLSQLAIRQARFEQQMTHARTSPTPTASTSPVAPLAGGGSARGTAGIPVGVLIAVVAGLVLATVLGGLLTAVFVMRGRHPAPGVVMSQDGAFWWDGVQWRVSASDPPPSAQVQPSARVSQ